MAYNSVANTGGIVAGVAGNEVQTESQIKLQNFWELEKADVEEMKPKQVSSSEDVFKQQDLPLARIKKIMKLDEDLKNMMISAEAPVLFAKAAELFIREITLRAWIHTERNKRRTLQRNDIAMAVADPDTDMFDFLIDIVPREEVKPQQARREDAVTPGTAPQTAVQAAAPVQQLQQPVQYVFQLPGQQCPQSIQILMPQQFQQAGSGVIVNGNGAAATAANTTTTAATESQMVAGSGMQVVQLMAPQQQAQAANVVTTSVDGAASVVRQATTMPIAGQQSMVVNAVPQTIQIQNLGGQNQPVILQPTTAGGVSSVCTVASATTAGATVAAESSQAQEVTGTLNAVVGATSEVTVKTDPLEDESSSPTQEG